MKENASKGNPEFSRKPGFSEIGFLNAYENRSLLQLGPGTSVDVEVWARSHTPFDLHADAKVRGITLQNGVDVKAVNFWKELGEVIPATGICELSSTDAMELETDILRDQSGTSGRLKEMVQGELIEGFFRDKPELVEKIGIEPKDMQSILLYVPLSPEVID